MYVPNVLTLRENDKIGTLWKIKLIRQGYILTVNVPKTALPCKRIRYTFVAFQ